MPRHRTVKPRHARLRFDWFNADKSNGYLRTINAVHHGRQQLHPQRRDAMELAAGATAEVGGLYLEVNVCGSLTTRSAHVGRGEVLPPLPLGFRWRLAEPTKANDDTPGKTGMDANS
jgi:hypothetical protein